MNEDDARELLARTWDNSREFNHKYTARLIRNGRSTSYDRIAISAICIASVPVAEGKPDLRALGDSLEKQALSEGVVISESSI